MGAGIIAAGRRRSAGGGGGGPTQTIRVAAGKTASDLSNYPIYVNLADMPAGFWSSVSSDGGNLRIKQGGSGVPFDLVKIDTVAKTGCMFIKAASLLHGSNNDFTYDFTGSGLLTATDPNGRNAVWSAFDLVWLCDDTATYVDRTGGTAGTKITGTLNASTSMGLNPSGCGLQASGASGAPVKFTARPSRTVFTIGVTARLDVTSISGNRIPVGYTTNTTVRMAIAARDQTPDAWRLWDNVNSWIGTVNLSGTGSIAQRFHGLYNGATERKFYAQGALVVTDAPITARPGTDVDYIVGGADTTGASFFLDGYIAYFYSRPEALSADYIAAEYSNLNAPSSFYSIT